MTRALILIRVSRTTDTGSSPSTQREDCERYCEIHGLEVVGIAEDLDTSGSTNPLERTGAGPWLHEDRLPEWDVIVAWKLHRVGRSARHISALMNYLIDHGKSLVCVNDPIDLSTPIGKMIVYILATIAEMDLANISAGNARASEEARKEGRFKGGTWPAGYLARRVEDGYRLFPDEDGLAPVMRSIVRRVLAGDRFTSIIADLNERGVPTPTDRQKILSGREPVGTRWSMAPFTAMLTSPTLVGFAVHRGSGRHGGPPSIVYDTDDLPIQRAEPLISEADFRSLQHTISERKRGSTGTKRSETNALLVRVIFCGVCKRPMYRFKQPTAIRYRCPSPNKGDACGNGSVIAAEFDALVARTMLLFSEFEYMEQRYRPGSNAGAEMAELSAKIERVTEALLTVMPGVPSAASLADRLNELEARRAELAALPREEAGYELVPTGRTFGEEWENLTDAGRNDLLRRFEVRLEVWKDPKSRTAGTVRLELGQTVEFLRSIDPRFGRDDFVAMAETLGSRIPDGASIEVVHPE
ncbi:recombinase family protein [Pseudonocardia hydrocarbonoxydans]|uniref:Integrase n=1 Tax=Pseudonocardia hydrocarbonoxydans TaxID=76726 RepID=A0A4Y3WWU2_9PSEU|nr:recombinase family protein [Pseudonocardia hydrocarbonoxydans]GEC21856.1 integrase [Pseudonocardia hydrocarbonoxydans]